MAQRRYATCVSVRSLKDAPVVPLRAWSARLFLQRHLLLGTSVGGERLVARRVAIVVEDECGEIGIALRRELTRAIRRDCHAHESVEGRETVSTPTAAEVTALERRTAELAIVEGGAVTILAAMAIGGLAAFHLLGGKRRRGLLWVLRAQRRRACHDCNDCKP